MEGESIIVERQSQMILWSFDNIIIILRMFEEERHICY
jgi:hypothetical protein